MRKLKSRYFSSLMRFGLSAENSLIKNLISYEKAANINVRFPREIRNCHFLFVEPEKIANPYLVAVSLDCLKLIGLDIEDYKSQLFVSSFSGNTLLPGLDQPYATVYGCHSYGTWFGQLGDGRAISLGDIISPIDRQRYEIQLKGSGRTPFSRGFDGKAVLRSSIREFLASEAMYHLGVSTTRALCIVGTGEGIVRPWYLDTIEDRQANIETLQSTDQVQPYPPDSRSIEEGAISTRVSPSFLRFSQLEIFAKRKELSELCQLVDYAIWREFPELSQHSNFSTRCVELLRITMRRNVQLVCDWNRIGFVQGNMNSDNMMLAGRTLDYGPFGWMERYDRDYQPFTSDRSNSFSFINQFQALKVNLTTLSESIEYLIHSSSESEAFKDGLLLQVKEIITNEFEECVRLELLEMRRKKLGLLSQDQSHVESLWNRLEILLFKFQVDYTIFFRLLPDVITQRLSPRELLQLSVYQNTHETAPSNTPFSESSLPVEWKDWFSDYLHLISTSSTSISASISDSVKIMKTVNPKYILRNWMSAMAYERAQKGDYSLILELLDVLSSPYEEGTAAQQEKWFTKTPSWAQQMPGVAFLSCSS